MRLLHVTEGVPTRAPVRGDGSSMISFELLRHLPDDVTVRLLTFGEPADLPQEVRARCADVVVLPLRDARLATVASVASAWSIGTHQRATRRARAEVRARSGEADVTLLHGPHVTRLPRAARRPLPPPRPRGPRLPRPAGRRPMVAARHDGCIPRARLAAVVPPVQGLAGRRGRTT